MTTSEFVLAVWAGGAAALVLEDLASGVELGENVYSHRRGFYIVVLFWPLVLTYLALRTALVKSEPEEP